MTRIPGTTRNKVLWMLANGTAHSAIAGELKISRSTVARIAKEYKATAMTGRARAVEITITDKQSRIRAVHLEVEATSPQIAGLIASVFNLGQE